MNLARSFAWTLLAAAGFALLPGSSAGKGQAQDPPMPRRPDTALSELVNTYKTSRGIAAAELPNARNHFKAAAGYYAALLAHPLIHRAPQDSSLKVDFAGNKLDANGRVIPTVDGLIKEIADRYLLEPNPVPANPAATKATIDNADYIREFGAAFDAALKPMIESDPSPVVRINAVRVLASICRTGAAAHWPTVTGLLTNANTPTEIKHYALQAAANLLSAYDVTDLKSRRHALSSNPPAAADKEIAQLVVAVQKCVEDPNALVPGIPGGDITKANPDQVAVVGFVRRQAVRALAQVRFVRLPGPNGNDWIYPSYTLARVCVSDPALLPAPSPAECAEAVIGLCNMAPTWNGDPLKTYNATAACEAVTAGLLAFAKPRADTPLDRSLPWRGYANRLTEALRGWPGLFDPLYVPGNPPQFDAKYAPKVVTDTVTNAQLFVLTPMDKTDASGKPDLGSRVQIEELRKYLKELQTSKDRKPLLFTDVPATTIDVPEKK